MNTEIINRALLKLGEEPISSENERPQGISFNLIYDDVRRSLLSMYVWRFAVKTADLAPLDEETETFRRYRFQMPGDLITVLSVGEMYKFPDLRDLKMSSGERYVILGDKIEACCNPLPLTYVADIDDATKYPPQFREALAARLALELTTKIHKNLNLYQLLESQFTQAINSAMQHNDIIQDTQAFGDNSWVAVREAWGYGD